MASIRETGTPTPVITSMVPVRNNVSTRARVTRVAFFSHLWIGIVATVLLLVIAVTGVLLNHKRVLGLMPDVAGVEGRGVVGALSLEQLSRVAEDTVASLVGQRVEVDRMDVRPGSGYVKVRMSDSATTEVTVTLESGKVLHVGSRGDVFLEKVHSGEVMGSNWILLSDLAAIALVLTLVTGYWLWVAPRLRHRAPGEGGA